MKSSLNKLRGLALHNHKERRTATAARAVLPLPNVDELAQAAQDLEDMKDCYDTLLSAAAATASSAFEFAESLRDMGSCLLEKTALTDHEDDTGKVLLMLGKMQFKLQKLIDNYRSHVFQTITTPSESLLNELRIVEEMKRQCEEKRDVYEYMVTKYKERGRSKGGKGETFTLQQLQNARDEYDQEATLFVFRLKSLKQGQSRSLLTQAARHHAAQLCFFEKAVKSLETVEPHVKSVTERQHIDYQFSGLEEENGYEEDGDYDDDNENDENDDGELSFDYGQNEQEQDFSTSQNSMELDQVEPAFSKGLTADATKEDFDRLQRNLFSFRVTSGSQSAPLFADSKPDPSEKLRQMRPSLSRKFSSYVLPTPGETKSSTSSGSINQAPSKMLTNLNEPTKKMWHSSPLEQKKNEKVLVDEVPGPTGKNAVSVLKESNSNTTSTRLLPPSVDGILSSKKDDYVSAYSKKIKRHAFSGPLTSNPWPTKPISVETVKLLSGPLLPTPMPKPPSSSPKVSPSASPRFMSSPKISELHELPRPPTSSPSNSRLLDLVAHSGPLFSRGQNQMVPPSNLVASHAASPLPMPPQAMPRSFSIPSSGARGAALQGSRALQTSHRSSISRDIASPPLTPVTLSNNWQ
ncbi:uncharacterized protein At2g33490 [Arachis stenosperma]|uniref:uncharacterized protein At2g33490 n=1 Tax=Arachis stenosperma TaxID=217475 RepID=UPI0025AB643A|nr:uncharacterized protein At2g33490 [Arachis stenosperma]